MARRYLRDNRGRFASTGATARGGRLRTASGNKRATQTMKVKGGAPSGTMRGKLKRDPGAMNRRAAISSPASTKGARLGGKFSTIKKARSAIPATTTNYRQALPVSNANRPRLNRAMAIKQKATTGSVRFQEMQKLRLAVSVANNPYAGKSKAQQTRAANALARAELTNKKLERSFRTASKAEAIYTNLVGFTGGQMRKKWKRAGRRATSLGTGTLRRGPLKPGGRRSLAMAATPKRRARMWYESRRRSRR